MSTFDRARATIKLAAKIAVRGGQQRLLTFVGTWRPKCGDPRHVYRAHTRMRGLRSVEVSMHVRCRRCRQCLQFRQMRWRQRALAEIATANRTWLVTLTYSPVQLAGVLASARSASAADVERRAYRDVQRWLDKVRDAGGRRDKRWSFRYLAVFERGEKSGRMHYHVLLHETGCRPIPKRVLEETWPSHVHARLVDPTRTGVASYVTKYMTKDFSVRPRASGSYGNQMGRLARTAKEEKRSSLPGAHTKTPDATQEETSLSSDLLRTDASQSERCVTLLKNGCDDGEVTPSHSRKPRQSCECSFCQRRASRAAEFQALHRSARAWTDRTHAAGPEACQCVDCLARRGGGASSGPVAPTGRGAGRGRRGSRRTPGRGRPRGFR